jgi:glycine betaine/proline transport system substrate-binding protein
MTRTRSRLLGVALIAATMTIAACSSDGDSGGGSASESGGGSVASSGDKPTIKIVENAWTASAIEAELAKQVIEKKLGNTVEIVKIDENTMFAGLSSGELDAVLEIWPSGITADEQKYFDDKSVLNAGDLGAVGKIGWWVPDYVLADHPELATSEGFKNPELAKLFATADTGDKGRFLGTDPSYSQYDETIIKNLDLPLQVVFSGSEPATVAELDARVAKKEPVVMYWWTPTAAVAKYNLKNVTLPAYSKECYADTAKIGCDYPEDVMIKAASAKLAEKDPAVLALIQKLELSNEDQLSMLPAVEIDKKPVSEVVAEWISANEAKVDSWLAA